MTTMKPIPLRKVSYYYKNKIPLDVRGQGVFQLGDMVSWFTLSGKIVEVVPYGMYPVKQPRLRVRGYYREYESYVVEDSKGRRYWPRVGNLQLIERKDNDYKGC